MSTGVEYIFHWYLKGKKQQIKKHKCRTHTVFSNNEEKLTEKLVLMAAVTKVQSLAFHVAYK